jgi:ribosomal-protein-alanine N-acetyltransferase
MCPMDFELKTERLILKRPTREDCRMLMMAIGDPKVAATTLNIPHPYSLDDAVSWIEGVNDPEKQKVSLDLSIFLADTGELIGGVGLSSINHTHHKAELGYWLAVDHWNKGIATEAAARVIRYGFEELNLERIYAICFVTNPASARVMEKIGMVYECLARHEFVKNGEFVDFHHYAILRSDWKKLQD